jgi:hypothetical protein
MSSSDVHSFLNTRHCPDEDRACPRSEADFFENVRLRDRLNQDCANGHRTKMKQRCRSRLNLVDVQLGLAEVRIVDR